MSAPSPRRRKLTRDLRTIVADGVFLNIMAGFGETYFAAFALALGHGETVSGLVGTVPVLVGSLLQLATPYGARRAGSYRRWTVAAAVLQGCSFAPLIYGAVAGALPVFWVFAAATAYWAAGLAVGPTWNVWVGALIPARLRGPFFAHRSRWMHFTLLLSMLSAGWLLGGAREVEREPQLFILLFAIAMTARFASSAALAATREIRGLSDSHRVLAVPAAVRSLRGSRGGSVLLYLLAAQGAAHIAAPFFTAYMLSNLGLSYGRFTLLFATAFAARMLVLPLIARLARRWSVHRILLLGGLGITPLPPLWLLSDHYAYLLLVQAVGGAAWAALEFGTLMSFFETLDEKHRVSVLSVYNLANAAAITLGSLVGAALLQLGGAHTTGYALLFCVSATARALALPLLLRAPRDLPAAAAVRRGDAAPAARS